MMESRPVSVAPRNARDGGMVSPVAATPSLVTCPRCREVLAIIRPESRRARGLTARVCPSLCCGYKLIVPM